MRNEATTSSRPLLEPHDDPAPAPRGRVPVVVLACFRAVPNPTPHWQSSGPAKSHHSTWGPTGRRGQDPPSLDTGPSLREPVRSWENPGVRRARRLPRDQPTRHPGSPNRCPSLGTRAGTTLPIRAGEGGGRGERKGAGAGVYGMFYPWADATQAEGREGLRAVQSPQRQGPRFRSQRSALPVRAGSHSPVSAWVFPSCQKQDPEPPVAPDRPPGFQAREDGSGLAGRPAPVSGGDLEPEASKLGTGGAGRALPRLDATCLEGWAGPPPGRQAGDT